MFPLSDTKTSGRFPVVTLGIIILNVIVFFLQMTSADLEALIGEYALTPSQVNFSDPATLLPFLTSQFLHGDYLHIGSNMWFLWIFGDNIEHRLGPLFLPFYLLGGVAAGLAQYLINPGSDIPTLGASGAVAAVLGAYLVLYAHHKVNTFVVLGPVITSMQVAAPIMLGYWFLIQVVSGITTLGVSAGQDIGGIAYFAHIGGFAFGWILAQPFKHPPSADPELNYS